MKAFKILPEFKPKTAIKFRNIGNSTYQVTCLMEGKEIEIRTILADSRYLARHQAYDDLRVIDVLDIVAID